ncbi:MAG TPA: radical SAM protein [Bacillota bacterium]|nr:radical SAM protein [Bacillota bacterium]
MLGAIHKEDQDQNQRPAKILLILLPFWTPLIPPMGICSLKSFLGKHNYQVKTHDANVIPELGEVYRRYFEKLKEFIPQSNWGNLYNMGNKVLSNHLMAYLNQGDETEYRELVKILIAKFYYYELNELQIAQLDEIIKAFYLRLEKYLQELFARELPDVLGISVFEGSLASSLYAFRWAKEKYPAVKTVMGGGIFSDQLTLGSPDLEFFLEKTPFIDHLIIGEGQNLFLKLLRGELPPSQRVFTLKDIQGETLDFTDTLLPDYSDLNMEHYPYLGATGSKSCPNQCSFCNVAVFWGNHRIKNPAQTAAEMLALYRRYGFQLFFMTDSLLNPIASELAQEFIHAGLILYWDGYYRVDEAGCDPENAYLWRSGGLYRVRIGVESGSQHVLDLMGKRITPEQIRRVVSTFANAGIKTTTYWVIGHPGETESDFQQTLDLLTELKDSIWEAECNPFYYFYNGQVNSAEWASKRILVYPETAKELLISQTWAVDGEPSRDEIYRRVFRFTTHCQQLGIPNPYTMNELDGADRRWENLHKNTVPPIIKFHTKGQYVHEAMNEKKLIYVRPAGVDAPSFDFE